MSRRVEKASEYHPTSLGFIKKPFEIQKLRPDAEIPYKEEGNESSATYNITLISRSDGRTEDEINDVNEFETGIVLVPPPGYHIEIVGKNNLYKTGYELVGGTMIIDPETRNALVVPLKKFKEGQDLEMPYQAVQMVIRKTEHAHIGPALIEVEQRSRVSTYDNGRRKQVSYSPDFMDEDEAPRPRTTAKRGGRQAHMF